MFLEGLPIALRGNWMYFFVLVIGCSGLVGISLSRDLLKKVISFSVFSVSIILVFLCLGYSSYSSVPILDHHHLQGLSLASLSEIKRLYLSYTNPIPSVLMLTAVVVGAAIQAIAFSLIVRIKHEYETLDEKKIFMLDSEFEDFRNRSSRVATAPAGKRSAKKGAQVDYLDITDRALTEIGNLLSSAPRGCEGIKICLERKGCSGMTYKIEYAQFGVNLSSYDEFVKKNGVKVFIDPKVSLLVIGTTMDYVDELVSSGFVFINPNEKGRCGCGESFYV